MPWVPGVERSEPPERGPWRWGLAALDPGHPTSLLTFIRQVVFLRVLTETGRAIVRFVHPPPDL
jgi:hypothetical protein